MKAKLLFLVLFLKLYLISFSQMTNTDLLTIDSVLKVCQTEAVGKLFGSFKSFYSNKVFTNENLKGKVVFANFWFAACPPCMAELPELNNLFDSLKTNNKFELISFTYEKQKVIKQIVKKYKIRYKVLSISPADCDRLILKSSFPNSILINKNGIIAFMKIGGSKDQLEIKETIFKDYYPKILKELTN